MGILFKVKEKEELTLSNNESFQLIISKIKDFPPREIKMLFETIFKEMNADGREAVINLI